MKNPVAIVLGIVLMCYYSLYAHAGNTVLNVDDKNIALGGYDLVAYFTTNEAMPGKAEYAHTLEGVTYYFASAENLAEFQQEPNRYMPKYGGYCAFAVANGKIGVPANPERFKLYNGELLLFFDDQWEGKRFNTSVPWNADEQNLYVKAEKTWSGQKK